MAEKIKYVIEHNSVREVKNIGEEGIISRGFDSLGNDIYIQNKDAGKSVELMRIALMDGEGGKKSIFIPILSGIILFVLFLVLGYVFFLSGGDEKQETNNIPIYNERQEEQNKIALVKEPNKEKQEVSQGENNRETEIENMRLNFEYEALQISYERVQKENEYLSAENQNLLQKNSELQEKYNIVVAELREIKNNPKNIDSEDFLLYLGTEVSKRCEKAEREGEKNACKDLFYNFVKYD